MRSLALTETAAALILGAGAALLLADAVPQYGWQPGVIILAALLAGPALYCAIAAASAWRDHRRARQ